MMSENLRFDRYINRVGRARTSVNEFRSAKMKDLFVFGILLFAAVANCAQSQVIQTEKGQIRGSFSVSASASVKYTSFRGIPYAQPPLGKLRFRESVEAEAWSHVLDCTKPKPVCLQHVGNGTTAGDEDCLYIDVHAPHTDFENVEKKAVLVWIYGSGLLTGYGLHDQEAHEFFIEQDVILVKIQHRLDLLGYLALDVDGVRGNAGLKDQNLALRWVQKNIEKFGGDASRVTLFGEGSSSAHVGYHMLLPQSKGLFQKTIHHGGSPLCPWAFKSRNDMISSAFKLGALFGASAVTSHSDLLERLQAVSAEKLVQSAHALSVLPGPLSLEFGVTIEEWLTAAPAELFKSGKINTCPVMLGFNKMEAILIAAGAETLKSAVSTSIQGISKAIPLLEIGIRSAIDAVSNVIEATNIVEVSTNYYYSMAVDLMQRYLVQAAESVPVLFYRMSLETEQNLHELYDNTVKSGEQFAEDFSVLFGRQVQFSKNSLNILNQWRGKIVGMWVSFAKDAQSSVSSSVTGGVKWSASGALGNQMDIGEKCSMGVRLLNPIYVGFEKAYEFVLSLGSVTSSVISGTANFNQFGNIVGQHISAGGEGSISGGGSSTSGSKGGSSGNGSQGGSSNNGSKGGSSGNGSQGGSSGNGSQGGSSGNGSGQGHISGGGSSNSGSKGGNSGSGSQGGSSGSGSQGGSSNNGSKGGSSGNGSQGGSSGNGSQGGSSGNGSGQGHISGGGSSNSGSKGGSSGSGSQGGSSGSGSQGGSSNNGSKGGSSGNGSKGGSSGSGSGQGHISGGGSSNSGSKGGSSGSSSGQGGISGGFNFNGTASGGSNGNVGFRHGGSEEDGSSSSGCLVRGGSSASSTSSGSFDGGIENGGDFIRSANGGGGSRTVDGGRYPRLY